MEIINVRSDNASSIIKMKKILNDPEKIIIAVIVADWCGACQQFKPVWHNTVENYITTHKKNKNLILATIQDTTMDEFNMKEIRGFPTIRVINNKQVIDEKLGGMPETHIVNMIDRVKQIIINKPSGHSKKKGKSMKKSKKKGKKRRKTKSKGNKRKTKSKGNKRKTKSKTVKI